MKNEIIIIDYVLSMLEQTKYTRLKHSLEDLKKALPFVDYFKTEEFMQTYLGTEEGENNAE